MKLLWSVVSFLAIAHLLAIAMFVTWLWQSNRLDAERLTTVRELFALTIPDAERAAEAEREAALLELEEAVAEQRRRSPPLPSGLSVGQLAAIEEMEHRSRRSLEQERAMFREQIVAAQVRVDEREARLREERERWEAFAAEQRERRESEQFEKAVRQYESVRPRQGKEMLMELIANGQMEQAVAYLDAMNDRSASRILGEFKTDAEIRLATELLEQLRTFGIPPESQETSELRNGQNRADTR